MLRCAKEVAVRYSGEPKRKDLIKHQGTNPKMKILVCTVSAVIGASAVSSVSSVVVMRSNAGLVAQGLAMNFVVAVADDLDWSSSLSSWRCFHRVVDDGKPCTSYVCWFF